MNFRFHQENISSLRHCRIVGDMNKLSCEPHGIHQRAPNRMCGNDTSIKYRKGSIKLPVAYLNSNTPEGT